MSTNLIEHLDLALLPVKHKKLLCNNLDRDESWVRLAILMQFELLDINVSFLRDRYHLPISMCNYSFQPKACIWDVYVFLKVYIRF